MITFSSFSPWFEILWGHLRANVLTVENKSKFAAGFEILNLKKISLQNPVNLTLDGMPTCT
jgi:hypothetical protein